MMISNDFDPSGTSFHGVTITATPKQIMSVMGESKWSCSKTNFNWCGMTDDGKIFTVYDWKMGEVSKNQTVEFHIGGFSKESEETAKKELLALIK
jgi:hypothetical protein